MESSSEPLSHEPADRALQAADTTPEDAQRAEEEEEAEEQEERIERVYHHVEFWSTVMLALATIATAWAGYQSAGWGGEDARYQQQAMVAIIRSGQLANLAEQRIAIHISLFTQWAEADSDGRRQVADLLFARFPQPLKSAAVAWLATQPYANPQAPATPFEMPEYVLRDRVEAERQATLAAEASAAADQASEVSDRYLLYTIMFALVLFFCGISGKFRSQRLDIAVLVIGSLVLLIATTFMLQLPVAP